MIDLLCGVHLLVPVSIHQDVCTLRRIIGWRIHVYVVLGHNGDREGCGVENTRTADIIDGELMCAWCQHGKWRARIICVPLTDSGTLGRIADFLSVTPDLKMINNRSGFDSVSLDWEKYSLV